MSPSLSDLLASTPLSGGNAAYVESQYEQYLRDPASVDAPWRALFESLPATPRGEAASEKQGAVSRLVQNYANRGHLIANIDPLGRMVRARPRVLEPDYVGLGAGDLDTPF